MLYSHNIKKVSILLRGQHYQHENDISKKKWLGSFFDIYKNFEKMILNPLQKRFETEIYISSWNSPVEQELQKISNNIILHSMENFDKKGYQQTNIIHNGLNLIPENKNDLIIILRFDLLYKKPITDWVPFNKKFDICLPWRGSGLGPKSIWKKAKIISDFFFIIKNNKNNLNKFKKTILENKKRNYELHWIYPSLIKKKLKIIFADNGFYPSKSCTKHKPNPIYINYNRPYHFNDVNINDLIDGI